MPNDYVITSKKVRPGFKAKLHYEESPAQPSETGQDLVKIYLWDHLEELTTSRAIDSHQSAIYELYQKIYPELIEYYNQDEPPQDIVDLIDQTPYTGKVRWLTSNDRYSSQDIHIRTSESADPDDRELCGVAYITDEDLQKWSFSSEEGARLIENEVLQLNQYANGQVYLLKIKIDGETEYIGDIYPTKEAEPADPDAPGMKVPLLRNSHLPTDDTLDDILYESCSSEAEKEMVKNTRWK